MKLFFLIPILTIAATSAESPLRKEYRELVRNARHDSSSDSSDSAQQIHLPKLKYGHPKLHVHHHKSHKHHNDGVDAGHILASWHQDDGHDKSSKSSSSSESQEGAQLESCTCQQFATTSTTYQPSGSWYPSSGSWYSSSGSWYDGSPIYSYTTSSWYNPIKRSFQNDGYVTTYSGFRLPGENSCFCPEMHIGSSDPGFGEPGSGYGSVAYGG